MKFRIYNEEGDYFDIEEDTIEDIKKVALKETEIRNWKGCWSSKLD